MTPVIPSGWPAHWTWNEYCSIERYDQRLVAAILKLAPQLAGIRITDNTVRNLWFTFAGGKGLVKLQGVWNGSDWNEWLDVFVWHDDERREVGRLTLEELPELPKDTTE